MLGQGLTNTSRALLCHTEAHPPEEVAMAGLWCCSRARRGSSWLLHWCVRGLRTRHHHTQVTSGSSLPGWGPGTHPADERPYPGAQPPGNPGNSSGIRVSVGKVGEIPAAWKGLGWGVGWSAKRVLSLELRPHWVPLTVPSGPKKEGTLMVPDWGGQFNDELHLRSGTSFRFQWQGP